MSCHVTPCHVVHCNAMRCDAMSCNLRSMQCHGMSHDVTSHAASLSCNAIYSYAMCCLVMSCCVMQPGARMLCNCDMTAPCARCSYSSGIHASRSCATLRLHNMTGRSCPPLMFSQGHPHPDARFSLMCTHTFIACSCVCISCSPFPAAAVVMLACP